MARASEEVKHYVEVALAANTRKAYATDVRRFKRHGGRIPSTPAQIASYLAAAAATLKPSTLARQVAAISYAHETLGLASPTKNPIVRRTLRGIRRARGVAPRQAVPLSREMIWQLAKPLPELTTIRNLRDAALILLAFNGGFRRSELASLNVGDVTLNEQGLLVNLRSSKTDQYQRGRRVAVPESKRARHCPVRAVRRWLRILERLEPPGGDRAAAPMFRSIDKHDNIRGRINSASISWILRRRLALNGLPTAGYSAHSFRAGLVTSAAKAGVPIWLIQRQTGHRSEGTVHKYIRDLDAFECNALTTLSRARQS